MCVLSFFQLKRLTLAVHHVQEKIQERVDVLSRTKDADEKKFKQHGVPWKPQIMKEVKHASLHVMELHMELSLDEAMETMASKSPLHRKREKALSTLTGMRGLCPLKGTVSAAASPTQSQRLRCRCQCHPFRRSRTDSCACGSLERIYRTSASVVAYGPP